MCAAAGFLYLKFRPETNSDTKEITVTVIHADKSEKNFTYKTNAGFLGDVLTENGLIKGEKGEYGLYITTVDGETADDAREQWWCILKGEESVNTAADKTPVQDGDCFRLILKEGYDY